MTKIHINPWQMWNNWCNLLSKNACLKCSFWNLKLKIRHVYHDTYIKEFNKKQRISLRKIWHVRSAILYNVLVESLHALSSTMLMKIQIYFLGNFWYVLTVSRKNNKKYFISYLASIEEFRPNNLNLHW